MSAVTFDTLAYSQKLQRAGISREQADAMATANAEAFGKMLKLHDLATKQDLANLKRDLELAIADTRKELELAIADTKSGLEIKMEANKHELLKWVVGMLATQTAFVVAAIGVGIAILK